MNRFNRLRSLDWDAVGGLVTAGLAVVLHLLNILGEQEILVIVTSLLGLLFFRSLREEATAAELSEAVRKTDERIADIRATVMPPELELVGPDSLRQVSHRFGHEARGELIWFNLCLLMLSRRETFDVLVQPAIDNPDISSLHFILDESQRDRWERTVAPKLDSTLDETTSVEVYWRQIDESIAFIHTSATDTHSSALVSFWGEPFMAETVDQDVTRYILHAREHSELIPHLRDLARRYRLQSGS